MDLGDAPSVLVPVWNIDDDVGGVVALEGTTGETIWSNWEALHALSPAIADLDGDGWPDVVTMTLAGEVLALDGATGTEVWRSAQVPEGWAATVTIADLEGDGSPEVLAAGSVLCGADGSILWSVPDTPVRVKMVAGDLDLDGEQEVLSNGAVYSAHGDRLWEAGPVGELEPHPVILQADEDERAEVGRLGEAWDASFALYEDDGELIRSIDLRGRGSLAPPCVGDFNGDGQPEVAWSEQDELRVRRLDGELLWGVPASAWADEYLTTPCSAFDLDGDGALEILYTDAQSFRVLRGSDGTVLMEEDRPRAGVLDEYPAVADVDGDGHAEILLAGAYEDDGPALQVLAHDGAGWAPTDGSWGQWEFAVTNANPGGAVPRSPIPSWLASNTWLARPAGEGEPLPDLAVTLAECRDGSRIAVSVENRGAVDVEGEVVVAAFEGADEVDRGSVTGPRAGERILGLVMDVPEGSGVHLVVDPDDEVEECREGNNEASLGR